MKNTETLRVHKMLGVSTANGPGRRFVLWLQGCGNNCPGCFNQAARSYNGGTRINITDIIETIKAAAIEFQLDGITISGGEPLEQFAQLKILLCRIAIETDLDIILFTGYEPDIFKNNKILRMCDVIIAGPYEQDKRIAHSLAGSSNQEFIFNSTAYNFDDMIKVPDAEIIINTDGTFTESGINPINLKEE